MYIHFNGNPCGINTGDCVIRAISIVTGMNRHRVYAGLCLQGFPCTEWGNINTVWADYLKGLGFKQYYTISNEPYTVSDFAADHPSGSYILGTGTHAVAVVDGNVVDSWDSSREIPIYYFAKE